MATFTLYDPATQPTPPLPGSVNDPSNATVGIASSILTVFNPQMPFSTGCILGGVVVNTSGQGQIYPTGRN
jgi:hypothetical protein